MLDEINKLLALENLDNIQGLIIEAHKSGRINIAYRAANDYAALVARIEKLEQDLRDAPNPYDSTFELSRYKGWWVTDRTDHLRAK